MGENGRWWDPKNFPWVPQASSHLLLNLMAMSTAIIIIIFTTVKKVMKIKARFTTVTMRVARMIKLQSDAKRGMYTCLEYEHRGQKLGEKVGLVDRRPIPIGNEAGDALCMLDLFSNICSHMHIGD